MTSHITGKDGNDADLRTIALALVAEAPPSPPLPAAVEPSNGIGLLPLAPTERERRRTWPIAVAAAVIVIAGIVAIGPRLRSSEQVSTSTVAAQTEQASPSVVPTVFPTAIPAEIVPAGPGPTAQDSTQFTTPGLSPPGLFLIAKPNDLPGVAIMSVYDEPGGEPRLLVDHNIIDGTVQAFPLTHPTQFQQPLVLRVVEGAIGDEWVRVQAPSRPHGRTVWMPTKRFEFGQTSVRIEVDIAGQGELTLFDGDRPILDSPIVSGRKERPTALHATYVEQILPGTQIGPAYGNWLISLASFSEVLGSFGPNGGLPGQSIHGTNQPALMGQRVSSGGVRVPDETMQRIIEVPNLLGAQVLKFDSNDPDATKEAVLNRPWLPAETAPYTENSGVPTIAYS